ncbi:MAG: TIM barrel protein [Thermoprotei archaeon]|nr:TIM barrel protein [Thermoprotei archaeon]
MKVRFGPAGRPLGYRGSIEGVPKYLRVTEGLDAFEYQAVRGVRIKEVIARALGEEASKYDVLLSLHAPYAINLSSRNKAVIEASKDRLLKSLLAASWMNARVVVFHPGYYSGFSPKEALTSCIDALRDVITKAQDMGIKGPLLGPETTGKLSQVGSLDEIISMCREVEGCIPVIDWAHIHAREKGSIRDKESYMRIIDIIERELGDLVKNLHCHFTKVEFGDKGERRHRTLSESGYGPPFEPLAEVIVEHGFNFTIISESPLLDKDAIRMKDILIRTYSKFKRKEQS